MIFDFLDMANNYEERKVDRFENEKMIIDTCAVSDSAQPYETGVKHKTYNNGFWVIVELYNTKKEAQVGHNKWIEIMTSDNLPDRLVDISSCKIAALLDIFGENSNYRCKPKQP